MHFLKLKSKLKFHFQKKATHIYDDDDDVQEEN